MTDLRYPIGPEVTDTPAAEALRDLAEAPARFREAVRGLDDAQLDTPYRSGGWTVRQVIHHVPDSHMNGYCRCRLALTEDTPAVKSYDERAWAELTDARTLPVEVSFGLLDGLHRRWAEMFRNLKPEEWKRAFRHSERGLVTLEQALSLYGWHSRHHAAHITSLRERMGWR
jgi:DinB superfamily